MRLAESRSNQAADEDNAEKLKAIVEERGKATAELVVLIYKIKKVVNPSSFLSISQWTLYIPAGKIAKKQV